ncbi:Hypothetical protein ABZS17I87_02742 [Kosakonia cowanii]
MWQHFYQNNFFNDEFTTHYVVLAYIFNVEKNQFIHPGRNISVLSGYEKKKF